MQLSNNDNTLQIPLTDKRIQLISNVIYKQVSTPTCENIALRMDLLVPKQRNKIPAVLFITGGQFIRANKDNCIQLRMALAYAGFVTASIEYRTAPISTFPKQLEDVKSAIRFLRAKANRFHIDSEKIAVAGESAGGYLASFAGLTNNIHRFDKGDYLDYGSDVQAVVDLYGPSDLSKIDSDFPPAVQRLYKSAGAAEALLINGIGAFGGIDGGILADKSRVEAANPINYIKPGAPPFLFMHGDKDNMVSPSQTAILHEALLNAGVNSARFIVKNAGHGGIYWVQPAIFSIIISFFKKHLLKDKLTK